MICSIDKRGVQESFQQLRCEEEVLDAQLSESLAALEAYQRHLDVWQQQLATEREELRIEREALERDRVTATENGDEELAHAREEIASLEARIEQYDQRQTELIAELDAQRLARDSAQHSTLDTSGDPDATSGKLSGGRQDKSATPVLGSIVEQFGKLRQQRALERQASKSGAKNS